MSIKLLALEPKHASLLYKWRLEGNTRRFNPVAPISLRKYRASLTKVSSNLRQRKKPLFRWMVEYQGVIIGSVSVDVNWRMNFGELGYILAQEYQGRGIGGKVVASFVDKLFRESKLERLTAHVAEKNVASRAILKKLGFSQEGILRKHFVIQGKRVNEIYYGILRSEWKPAKKNPDAIRASAAT